MNTDKSTSTFYKATRPDGTDFYSGMVLYEVGRTVRPNDGVPRSKAKLCHGGLLHAATVPTETLIIGSWPCRLFVVDGKPVAGLDDEEPYKAGFRQLRVVEELPAWRVFGPQGREVVALIERAALLTVDELKRLGAAWDAARTAACDAAWNAAAVLVARDLISDRHFQMLYDPWASVIGE